MCWLSHYILNGILFLSWIEKRCGFYRIVLVGRLFLLYPPTVNFTYYGVDLKFELKLIFGYLVEYQIDLTFLFLFLVFRVLFILRGLGYVGEVLRFEIRLMLRHKWVHLILNVAIIATAKVHVEMKVARFGDLYWLSSLLFSWHEVSESQIFNIHYFSIRWLLRLAKKWPMLFWWILLGKRWGSFCRAPIILDVKLVVASSSLEQLWIAKQANRRVSFSQLINHHWWEGSLEHAVILALLYEAFHAALVNACFEPGAL